MEIAAKVVFFNLFFTSENQISTLPPLTNIFVCYKEHASVFTGLDVNHGDRMVDKEYSTKCLSVKACALKSPTSMLDSKDGDWIRRISEGV